MASETAHTPLVSRFCLCANIKLPKKNPPAMLVDLVNKRICVVSLSGREPMMMLSGFVDGELHIIKADRLPRSLSDLKKTLPNTIEKLRGDGFIVLVDEVIPFFGKFARPCRLSDIDQAGRPIVVSAMECYRNLMSLRAITFPTGGGSVFEISSSVVDEQRNDRGEAVYKIDWSELKPETTCLLLSINAAVETNLYDDAAMQAFLSEFGINKQGDKPLHSGFIAATRGYDKKYMSADVFHSNDGDE